MVKVTFDCTKRRSAQPSTVNSSASILEPARMCWIVHVVARSHKRQMHIYICVVRHSTASQDRKAIDIFASSNDGRRRTQARNNKQQSDTQNRTSVPAPARLGSSPADSSLRQYNQTNSKVAIGFGMLSFISIFETVRSAAVHGMQR